MTKEEALRLALEAMKINNKAWKLLADSGDAGNWEAEEQGYYQLNEQAINAIKEALETKDEPFEYWNAVGWFGYDTGLRLWFETDKNDDGAIPLYKDQQQRTWVGLTEEDLKPICDEWHIVYGAWVNDFARDIESKLKEKNT